MTQLPVPTEKALEMYKVMVRIRKFELTVSDLYAHGRIPGFLHTYVGEEAVATGVCAALRPEDYIISTHRGHGHLLAKGGRTDLAMAELYGKATGYNKGKGGSMHIAEPDLGMLGANAIVGAGIAIINGAALTAQYLGTGQVAICFFGDGASNEGTFHESLNLASCWQLPSIFVCENNEYAESTPRSQHQRVKDIAIRALAYDMPSEIVDGNDVCAVYLAASRAVDRARSGGGPTLIEAKTTRWRGHHEADNQAYRPKEDLEKALANDAIERWGKVLLETGIAEQVLENIRREIDEEIQRAVAFAESSPLPDPADACTDIYTPA